MNQPLQMCVLSWESSLYITPAQVMKWHLYKVITETVYNAKTSEATQCHQSQGSGWSVVYVYSAVKRGWGGSVFWCEMTSRFIAKCRKQGGGQCRVWYFYVRKTGIWRFVVEFANICIKKHWMDKQETYRCVPGLNPEQNRVIRNRYRTGSCVYFFNITLTFEGCRKTNQWKCVCPSMPLTWNRTMSRWQRWSWLNALWEGEATCSVSFLRS